MAMNISLVKTTLDGKEACLAVLGMKPGSEIPAARILGTVTMDGDRPAWSTFRRNTTFADRFARYMRGEAAAQPAILDEARVKPGEYVYVIDPRTPTPQGRVPFDDIVGWYESDPDGDPRPETFTYNPKHLLVTEEGRWSGVLEDKGLAEALVEPS